LKIESKVYQERVILIIGLIIIVAELLWGLFSGKDLIGRSWSYFDTVFFLLAIVIIGWRILHEPRRLELAELTLDSVEPIELRIVLEFENHDGGPVYSVFIRGIDSADSSHTNWRAEIVEPYPSELREYKELDLKASVWFTKHGEPIVVKIHEHLLRLRNAKKVGNRWDS
jgi:hypothetical protein